MCRVLGVSRTGFRNWERRAPSDRALTDAWLIEKIKLIHEQSRGVYGVPRIHAELRLEHEVRISRKRVARLCPGPGQRIGEIGAVRRRRTGRSQRFVPGGCHLGQGKALDGDRRGPADGTCETTNGDDGLARTATGLSCVGMRDLWRGARGGGGGLRYLL